VEELPASTVYLLKRAELAVRGCLELALGALNMTPSQYFILVLAKSREATSSAELARAMGVLPQSMTELIAPLERRGAIVRRPDPANGRILRTELTSAGEDLFESATEIAMGIERELLDGFAEREIADANRFLSDLITHAEAHSFHPTRRRLAGGKTPVTKGAPRSAAKSHAGVARRSRGKRVKARPESHETS